MPATTKRPTISTQQYHSLQALVVEPTAAELFDFQVATLKDKGVELPSRDVDRLRALVPNEVQLFLLVPPQPDVLDLDGLMHLVEVDSVTGMNYLDRQHLSDVIETPKTAHLLLDVEDGRTRLNTKPSVSSMNITQEGRLAYTTWRGLIHGIVFPCVLQDHNLDLVGSRYKSVNVPSLYLKDGVPRLYYGCSYWWYGNTNPEWGAPSAGSALGT